jgi:hypothetical protein
MNKLSRILSKFLDHWNAGGTQWARRSKERGRDGDGHGTKTLASL